ncbi:tetratricopeptide repeat protein [Flammeovirga aprica]|uniref:Tetratricopeptide repeat protein n=1 Tax=Flammeovirga aprica JL-4 TaxID=694437 RepID=A0A7X9RZZ4_9BACT|nr:tetratricopeptide repeat protein [Flammeovirga aprica]NME71836.1 tetratricopeptide repeat protein [Flammeovirga aprica JL-4]
MTKIIKYLLSSVVFFIFLSSNSFAQNFNTYFADGKAAFDQKNYNKAIQKFQTARSVGKETIGETHPDYILNIEFLAKSYEAQKDLGNANIYYTSLEKLLVKSGNAVSKKMGDAQEVIADNSLIMKNFPQADVYYQKALTTREKSSGKASKDYTLTYHKYARLYLRGRKYKEAETMYRNLEDLAEKTIKGTDEYAQILSEQAEVFMGLKRIDEASMQLNMSIAAYEKTKAPKSSYVQLYLQEASLLEKTGQKEAAIKSYYKYIDNLAKAITVKNPKYITEVERLAIHLDEALNSPKDAHNFIKKKLVANIATFTENSTQVAVTYIELAEIELNLKNIPLAEQYSNKAIAIYQELGKDKSPEGIVATITSARVKSQQKKDDEAEKLYKKAITDAEQHLSDKHTSYGQALDSLAFFYIERKRFEDAENEIMKGLGTREKNVGKQHIDYGNSLYSLSRLYSSQDSLVKAEKALKSVAKVREGYYGALTLEHVTCIKELGDLYAKMGEEKKVVALKTYRRAISLYEGIGMKDSPVVKEIYGKIDEINAQ